MAYKILIVEDERFLLQALADKFTQEGFQVFRAKNGVEGLDQALKEHPDILLLDIIMPLMDGMTLLKRIREDEWGKKVPVIFLTNLFDSDKVAEAVSHEAYDFLIKSDWQIEDVVEKVREKLDPGSNKKNIFKIVSK